MYNGSWSFIRISLVARSENMKDIYSKLKNKEEKLAVVGLGYVGMPLAVAFAEKFQV